MPMTPEEFKQEMDKRSKTPWPDWHGIDQEAAHSAMDDLMCQVLEELGYVDGIKIFKAADKWYA